MTQYHPDRTDSRGNHYTFDPVTFRYTQVNPPVWTLSDSERLQSGRLTKQGAPRKYGWEQAYRNEPRRRPVCQGDNINFICQNLYDNPGARNTAILRALCEHNRGPFKRGQDST